jgi:hypothetical protein
MFCTIASRRGGLHSLIDRREPAHGGFLRVGRGSLRQVSEHLRRAGPRIP